MAIALALEGISVTTLAPGFIATDMAAPLLDAPVGDAIRSQSPSTGSRRLRRWLAPSSPWPNRVPSGSRARSWTSTAPATCADARRGWGASARARGVGAGRLTP